ncbi:hypothetical protein [Microbacterium flavum]|uniref:hypothetical protein n=1 Tax=Microbacterium flavum TaxID=415216 RepID=UPI0024AD4B0F|nr:hypothetical protein [Microbacterium flavum]
MADLLPAIAFGLCVLVDLVAIVTVWRAPGLIRSRRTQAWIAAVVLLVVALPYLAFVGIQGDPDVWDFYRSVGLAPVLILGPLSVWAVCLLVHTRPASRSVADRPGLDAQRLSHL